MNYKSLFLLLILLFIVLAVIIYFKREQDFKKILPQKIDVSKILLVKEKGGLGQSCGLILYKLSNDTKQKIEQQGLEFFKNATKARGYHLNQKSPYYLYQEWQRTPLQEKNSNKNFWAGLSCANQQNLDRFLLKRLSEEMSLDNSYYTGHYEGQLVIIPKMEIVIFAYSG